MSQVFIATSDHRLNCATRLLLDQAGALIELGHQPVLVCQPGSEFELKAIEQGLEVIAIDFAPLAWPKSIHQFAMACIEHRPVALITASGKETFLLGLLTRLLARFDPAFRMPRFLRLTAGPMQALDELFSTRFSDKLFAPSQAAIDQWFRWPAFRLGQREVLPAVVKRLEGPFSSDRRYKHQPNIFNQVADRHLIIQIAGAGTGLDPDFSARLATGLAGHYPDLTWLVLGRQAESVDWSAVRNRHGLSPEQLLGHSDTSCFQSLLETAQAVVSPVAHSASTQRLLEAMSQGVPVAASRLGAQQELLNDSGAGWLCRPFHEEGAFTDWFSALQTILERGPEVQSRLLTAVRFVEASHSPQASAAVLARNVEQPDGGHALAVWSRRQPAH